MRKIDKAKAFGSEVRRRLPDLSEKQANQLAHAYTASQHGYPQTSQGIYHADLTYFYVMRGWKQPEAA